MALQTTPGLVNRVARRAVRQVAACLAVLALLQATPAAAQETPRLQDFLAKLAEAARPLDGEQSLCFLSPGRDPAERPTLLQKLEEVKPYLTEEELPLKDAQQSPQAFTLGGTMNSKRGGLIVWRNDVFPADFFVRCSREMKGESPAGQDLAARLGQPWFEWTGGALTYHTTGAQDRIFSHLQSDGGPAPRHFRGTTDYEAMVLELGRKLAAREPLDPGWRESLRASLQKLADHAENFYRAYEKGLAERWATQADVTEKRQKWEKVLERNRELVDRAQEARSEEAIRAYVVDSVAGLLNLGEFHGLFTTPDFERARLFSKGQVVEFSFERQELAALLAQERLYVGFEKMLSNEGEEVQLELAILGANEPQETRRLAEVVLRAYRRSTPHEPSQLFN